jgi:DNA-binding response OmpR family regulator
MPRYVIADHDASFRDECRRSLAARGYQVKVAADGQQCMQQCQAKSPTVLLLDAELFWDRDVGVLEWLRQQADPNLVTVLLVGQQEERPVPARLRHVVSAKVARPESSEEFDRFLSHLEDEVWWAQSGQYLY